MNYDEIVCLKSNVSSVIKDIGREKFDIISYLYEKHISSEHAKTNLPICDVFSDIGDNKFAVYTIQIDEIVLSDESINVLVDVIKEIGDSALIVMLSMNASVGVKKIISDAQCNPDIVGVLTIIMLLDDNKEIYITTEDVDNGPYFIIDTEA